MFNPSIAFSPVQGWRMACRSSNYVMNPRGEYQMPPDNVIRTTTYLAVLDSQLTITELESIDDSAVATTPPLYPWVRGIEDARLFWNGSGWSTIGVSREHREDGLCEQTIDKLDGTTVIERYVCPSPNGWPQKSWVPVDGMPGTFVYQAEPLTLIRPIHEPAFVAPETFPEERGSTHLCHLPGNQWLSVVHHVLWDENGRRSYWHKFAYYSDGGRLAPMYSPSFCFVDPGIEYAAGMVIKDNHAVISFGYRDVRAMLAIVPIPEVMSLLQKQLPA